MYLKEFNRYLTRLAPLFLIGAGLFFAGCSSEKENPSIVIEENYASISVSGVDELPGKEDRELLSVYVIESDNAWQATDYAVQGSYSFKDGLFVFTPRHPFLKDTEYYVRFDADSLLLEYRFIIPSDTTPVTYVEEVYPSTDQIPRNVLKFYVQFSGSMMEGEMLDHIRIIDSDGIRMEHVFLEIPQELWGANSKRLTILFDPARIKRGMDALDQYGAAFQVGQSYTLIIDKEWKDAGKRVLTEPFQKTFTIAEDDRIKPEAEDWNITPPFVNTEQELVLDFFESMDYGLLNRVIDVKNEKGGLVKGNVTFDEDQTRWIFTPDQPWNEEEYTIEIEVILEDLAGNNLFTLFDVDLKSVSEPTEDLGFEPFVKLPFRPTKE